MYIVFVDFRSKIGCYVPSITLNAFVMFAFSVQQLCLLMLASSLITNETCARYKNEYVADRFNHCKKSSCTVLSCPSSVLTIKM